MSVFDKFQANRYVSTYIGAPVNEMAQAMAARTQRADKFYAQEDALEDAFRQDVHLQIDDALFNESQQAIRAQIEELAKNPHQSERQIKALSRQYANDDNLRIARSNYAAYKNWESKFEEDPAKYGGDIVSGLAMQKLAQYKGAAKGDKLKFDALYEHKDINKTLMEAAKTIKERQDVIQTIDGRFLNTKTKKYITREQAASVLSGTLMNDPTIVKQMQEMAQFSGQSMQHIIGSLITPQVEAITNPQFNIKSQALPKEGGSGSGDGASPMGPGATHAGPSMVDETHGQFRGKDAQEVMDMIDADHSETGDVLRREFTEYFTGMLGEESSSDRHATARLKAYLNEKGIEGIRQITDGNYMRYNQWQQNKYNSVKEIPSGMQRRLESGGINGWFGDKYGDDIGDGFADKYSAATTNMVVEDAQIGLKNMGFSSSDATNLRNQAWGQLKSQASLQVFDPESGKAVKMSQEEFLEKHPGEGKLVGFGQSSDYGEFKTVNSEGVEQILYIKMPADQFGITAKRFNQGIAQAYGDGTNVNYAKLGQSAMGLNPKLAGVARTVSSQAFNGKNNIPIPLERFSARLDGQAVLKRDADGDYTLEVNGKDMLATNPEAAARLTNSINSQDANVFAGILSGIGVELNKSE